MKHWTLGFIFDQDLRTVLLICKKRPAALYMFWNGIGGKFEPGESATQCMKRELYEETNLLIPDEAWRQIGRFGSNPVETQEETWEIDVFVATYDGSKNDAQSKTDEQVAWFSVDDLPKTVQNLQWLIPLSIYAIRFNHIKFFDVRYTDQKEWLSYV